MTVKCPLRLVSLACLLASLGACADKVDMQGSTSHRSNHALPAVSTQPVTPPKPRITVTTDDAVARNSNIVVQATTVDGCQLVALPPVANAGDVVTLALVTASNPKSLTLNGEAIDPVNKTLAVVIDDHVRQYTAEVTTNVAKFSCYVEVPAPATVAVTPDPTPTPTPKPTLAPTPTPKPKATPTPTPSATPTPPPVPPAPTCSLSMNYVTTTIGTVSVVLTPSGVVSAANIDGQAVAASGGNITMSFISSARTVYGTVTGPGGQGSCSLPIVVVDVATPPGAPGDTVYHYHMNANGQVFEYMHTRIIGAPLMSTISSSMPIAAGHPVAVSVTCDACGATINAFIIDGHGTYIDPFGNPALQAPF